MSTTSEMAWALPFVSAHSRDKLLRFVQDVAIGGGLGLQSELVEQLNGRGVLVATFSGTPDQLDEVKRWRGHLSDILKSLV